jgi:hypothetical protein
VVLQAKWEDNKWEVHLWEVTLQWEEVVSDRWDLVHQAKAVSGPMLHPIQVPYSVAQSKIHSRSE